MFPLKITRTSLFAVALSVSPAWVIPAAAQSTDAQTTDPQAKPDNTAVNKRDQSSGEATADQQKMNADDRELTAKIRRSIVADKALSTYAHNVKIISQNGMVTLKGPVRSDDEVKSIVSKAVDVTGTSDKVINQLSVKPASKP
jgi:hyperosmotically inducible periplasmic protein